MREKILSAPYITVSLWTPHRVVHEAINTEIALLNLVHFIQMYIDLVILFSFPNDEGEKWQVIQPVMSFLQPVMLKKKIHLLQRQVRYKPGKQMRHTVVLKPFENG